LYNPGHSFYHIYVFPNVTGALKKTEVIEYGSLQVTDQVTAYIVRKRDSIFANKPEVFLSRKRRRDGPQGGEYSRSHIGKQQ
jgi:hypothetical protein